jgi:hypothetical protein
MERDCCTTGFLSDPTGIQERLMIMVDAHPGLHGHRHAVPRGREDGGGQDHPKPVAFVRQCCSPTFASDLGDWATKVQVDMINAVFGAQDFGRARHDRRIDAVQLDGPYPLPWVELQHRERLAVPLDDPTRSDHLADVQARTLLAAQLTKRRIRDARHGSQHDGRIDGDLPNDE